MTSTFFGVFCPAATLPRTPAIERSTLRLHPSGCAFTQMKPRERRLMICIGIRERYYRSGRACLLGTFFLDARISNLLPNQIRNWILGGPTFRSDDASLSDEAFRP